MDFGTIILNDPGNIVFTVTWDPMNGNMDTTIDPTISNFTFEVDGSPRSIATLQWSGTNELAVEAVGSVATVSMRLTQDLVDLNVKNQAGILSVPPETAIAFV